MQIASSSIWTQITDSISYTRYASQTEKSIMSAQL